METKRTHGGQREQLEGQRFGRLTVLEFLRVEGRRTLYRCRCECGNEKVGAAKNLKCGDLKSCGCAKREGYLALLGQRVGRLAILELIGPRQFRCACDCGGEAVVGASNLLKKLTRSCGCIRRERTSALNRKHGLSLSPGTRTLRPEFNAWRSMINRCTNPDFRHYHRYGGRGIFVCEGWRVGPDAFLADMGPRPDARHTLDRIDNDGSYTCGKCEHCKTNGWPANCRWATRRIQGNNRCSNRLFTWRGKTLSIAQWAAEVGLPEQVIRTRLTTCGWDVERALTTPKEPRRPRRKKYALSA